MKKNKVVMWIITVMIMSVFTSVFLSSCSGVKVNNKEDKSIELMVSVAASLKDAMLEIKEGYEKNNVKITYNFGSSGSLQRQIEQGAEVDIFISAATKQMDELIKKGLIIEETRKNFLQNRIVLVVPQNSKIVNEFEDLLKEDVKRIAIGEPESVPVGQYGVQIFKNMGIMDAITSKMIYGKDVKEVLAWVETGNVDAGIVYETDYMISKKVKLVKRALDDTHSPVYYPAGVIKGSKNEVAAREFIDFLYGDKAKIIFEKYGFVFNVK